MQKEIPAEVMKQLKNWEKQANILRVFHIFLGITLVVASVTVASRLLEANSLAMALTAWLTAITSSILVSMGLEEKSNDMRTAWRMLNVAILRYQTQDDFKIDDLITVYKTAETVIGDVKVNVTSSIAK